MHRPAQRGDPLALELVRLRVEQTGGRMDLELERARARRVKAGKILIAMIDPSLRYRHDITEMHEIRAFLKKED
jgi:hypothetical protein